MSEGRDMLGYATECVRIDILPSLTEGVFSHRVPLRVVVMHVGVFESARPTSSSRTARGYAT